MAALCPGVQYGLSSQENFGENKDLVFVKLTDSAYRAIEEYLRNQNKFSVKSPTIKFLGNEGQLCFPSGPPPSHQNGTGGNHGSNNASSTTFKFSLSSTADMEGPGGSFECVQHHQTQAPRRALGALGAIPHKMRIHATDDVYEETRKRMTFAEKVHKNKCTREIKMNQTDIGRKVKVKQSSGSNSSRSSSSNRRDPPPSSSSLPSSLSSSSNTSNNNPVLPPLGGSSSNNIPTAATPKLSPYSSSSSGFPTSSSSNSSNNIGTTNGIHLGKNSSSSSQSIPPLLNSGGMTATSNNHRQQNGGGGGVTSGGGLRSNHVSSSRPQKPSMQDVARRPLKERLIHLLALRPFKKIEIHERLNKEGLRERNGMSSVLKQISSLKDNCFYLNRAMWNEVNEDWPFYTESEKQMLKRRKPQNLTPPGGSDGGSSGSGNSPTSTHPGSPPPPMSMPMSTSGGGGGKRPSNPAGHGAHYGDTIPGHPELPMGSLRQRISHLKQRTPEPNYHQRSPPVENNSQRRPMTDSRDASNMNPRSRETANSGSNNNTGYHHSSQSQSSQHHYGNGTSNNYQYPTQPAPPVGGGGGHQQQQQQPQQHQPSSNGYATNGNKRSFSGNLSDDDEMTTRKRPCDSHTLSFNVNREKSSSNSATPADHNTTPQHDPISPKKQPANKSTDSSPRGSNSRNSSSTSGGRKSSEHSSNMPPAAVDTNADHSNYYSSNNNSHRWNSSNNNGGGGGGGNTGATSGNVTSSTQGGRGGDSRVTTSSMMVTAARVSPDSQSDRIATMAVEQQQQQEVKGGEGSAAVEGDGEKMELDYQTEYVAIRDIEQRRRYKSMFYADYEEYKELHGVVEKVSQRFVELDERLKQETNTTSTRYKEIKKQILREYQMNKRDHAHQTAKRRFDYLHGKLSHIKQLVSDYDATMTPTVPPPLLGN